MKYSTQKVGGLLTKVSPAALTCLSIAGVVGTAVTAVTATPKAMMLVEQKKREMKEVYFDEYCKTCCYEKMEENCDSCGECLEKAVNLHSHKPANWKAKEE